MAWMSDEQYLLMTDTRDKKITARSSRSTRTHNGKRGAVKFPSDYLSKKELKAMNGPVTTYRMNSPISWEEFKSYPEEHQKTYIQLLRKKWNVPNKYIAEMFGINANTLNSWFKCLGLNKGMGNGAKVWDREGFLAWRGGAPEAVKPSETPVEEVVERVDEIPIEEAVEVILKKAKDDCEVILKEAIAELEADNPGPIAFTGQDLPVIPKRGSMTFEYNSADDALATIKTLLSNAKVNMTISWECVFEDDACCARP